MSDFNPFAGAAQSFNQGAQLGAEYAKTRLDAETRQSQLELKRQELEQIKRQRDLDTGKWFMEQVEKIAPKQPGKYKNTLIESFQKGLSTIGYQNSDALASMLVDENYANDLTTAIANYHNMTPEMQQQWLPEISKFINSGDPAEQLKQFVAQAGDIEKLKLQKDLELRNTLAADSAKKKGEKGEKNLQATDDTRKNLQAHDIFTEYASVRANFSAIRDAAQKGTAFRDVGALFAINKLFDPRSVVRESEFAIALKTGSAVEGVSNVVRKLWNGEKLSAKQRGELLDIAATRLKDYKERYEAFSSGYLDEKEASGVNRKAADPGAQFIAQDNATLAQLAEAQKRRQKLREDDIKKKTEGKVQGYDSQTLSLIAKLKAKGYGKTKIEVLIGRQLPEDLIEQFGLE